MDLIKKSKTRKTNFRAFSQHSCSNFGSQLCKDVGVTKVVKFEGAWDKLEKKTVFRDNNRQDIWHEIKISYKIGHYRKVQLLFLSNFLLVLTKVSVWEEDLVLGLRFFLYFLIF